MTTASETDQILVERIRQGEEEAWRDLISRFEGRLLAFVESRLHDRTSSEDIVQETFVGFLNSLPNYDRRRPLESYLFSICAYKLTDCLRRSGRRPSIPFSAGSNSDGEWGFTDPAALAASSIARSGERKGIEEKALIDAIAEQIERWQQRGEWIKLQCVELLFVRGWANKEVAARLGITEQHVANYKFDFIARMSSAVRKQGLNADIFPELYPEV